MPLEKEIEEALNRACAENESNTPDWILSQYLLGCLRAFNQATQQRESWYGRDPRPTEPRYDVNSDKVEVPIDVLRSLVDPGDYEEYAPAELTAVEVIQDYDIRSEKGK